MLGERGQDRKRAVRALAEAEQAGELPADQIGRVAADRGGGARREQGEPQAVVRLPHPVGGGAQEIGLALGRRGRRGRARRSRRPAGDGERDLVAFGRGADPEIEILLAVGGERGAGNGDAEPAGEPGQRRDLRDGEHAAFVAAGRGLQRGERRIGRDQPALGIDPADHFLVAACGRGAHAASAEGRARVEMRATLAR